MAMNRFFLRVILLFIIGLLGYGCAAAEKPIWERMKITDLEPPSKEHGVIEPLRTINFDAYVFEIPAENIKILGQIREILSTQPLHFNNHDTFQANSFFAGFGQIQMWGKVSEVLRGAGAEKAETNSLLLPDGQADDIFVARLRREQTFYYVSSKGLTEGVTLGQGALVLRIKAEKIAASRGVCGVTIQPVFVSRLSTYEKPDEFYFTSCGFELKMSGDDFVILCPEEYISGQATLNGLLFSRSVIRPVIRIYLIFCVTVSD
jgi:hypothetical protein